MRFFFVFSSTFVLFARHLIKKTRSTISTPPVQLSAGFFFLLLLFLSHTGRRFVCLQCDACASVGRRGTRGHAYVEKVAAAAAAVSIGR